MRRHRQPAAARRWLCLPLVLTMAVVTAWSGPVAEAKDPPPDHVLSWQSAGDSYSSGEGVFGNEGDCAQSAQAYGPVALALLQKEGWRFGSSTFTACTGRLVEDYLPRPDGGPSLWTWGVDQGGPDRVDVLSLSFGGNDIGFADVLEDCLIVPTSWRDAREHTGCNTSEEELKARADWLLDPRTSCSGSRQSGDGFDCDLNLGSRRGSIIDFYFDVVTRHLTPEGRLYVVGYPALFAPVHQWAGWRRVACKGVKRGDTEKLGRVAEHVNNKLQEAVQRANAALGAERVVFVDRYAAYRDGLHELCGTNEDWLNGVAVHRGLAGNRMETSYHPNAAGHAATAALLVDQIQATLPRTAPHAYERGGLYLTFVPADPADARFRLVFEVGSSGAVQSIHAGLAGPAGYIEGCA